MTIVADFDFTLTHFRARDGARSASCHKVIEDCGLLHEDYHEKAQALQTKYYALEIDTSLSPEQKEVYMIEWVTFAHELLIKSNLSKAMLEQAVSAATQAEKIRLRDRVPEFFTMLKNFDVPLLIFSAGIADVLDRVIAHSTIVDPSLVYTLSNRCIFDEGTTDQNLIGFAEPVLHVCNKKSSSFLHTGFFCRPDYSERKNLIVLGDSLGDAGMSEGINYDKDTLLNIGFLNDKVEERLEIYLDTFDMVILDDPAFDVPLELIKAICNHNSEFLDGHFL